MGQVTTRQVRGEPVVEKIKNVRRTRDGKLLTAVKKGENLNNIGKVTNGRIAGAEAKAAKEPGSKVTLRIRDMDALTTTDEVSEAMLKSIKAEGSCQMVFGTMKETFGQGLVTTVRLGRKIAKVLLQTGYLRIGQEWINMRRCYKCWEMAHTANRCTGFDRSGRCHNCNEEDHLAKECKRNSFCPLCDRGHMAATGACPKFRIALSMARKDRREKTAVRASRNEGEAEGSSHTVVA